MDLPWQGRSLPFAAGWLLCRLLGLRNKGRTYLIRTSRRATFLCMLQAASPRWLAARCAQMVEYLHCTDLRPSLPKRCSPDQRILPTGKRRPGLSCLPLNIKITPTTAKRQSRTVRRWERCCATLCCQRCSSRIAWCSAHTFQYDKVAV